jgi:serine protease inhibitor
MGIKYDTEEALWADMDREIKEIVNFDLLTDEQRIFSPNEVYSRGHWNEP